MFSAQTRVLVVDDMLTMRKIVTKTCQKLGFQNIVDAANGALAWQIMNQANPPIELVISDWNMPESTGIDLLKRVRADSRYSKIPFVLVTAEAEQHQIVEAMQAGVSGYVIKPFSADTLKEKLDAIGKKIAA